MHCVSQEKNKVNCLGKSFFQESSPGITFLQNIFGETLPENFLHFKRASVLNTHAYTELHSEKIICLDIRRCHFFFKTDKIINSLNTIYCISLTIKKNNLFQIKSTYSYEFLNWVSLRREQNYLSKMNLPKSLRMEQKIVSDNLF